MSTRKLNDEWTALAVGRMHRCNITNNELAKRCNYSPTYLSQVLHCNKKFRNEDSEIITRNHILTALAALEEEVLHE